MTEPTGPGVDQRAGKGPVTAASDDHHSDVDWIAAERSPEFKELIAARRRWVLPATVFFLAWYFGFILLAGYSQDFMGESIYQGFTVGYLLALSQFVMVWVLSVLYLRKADNDFDPLAERAAARALEVRPGHGAADEGVTR